MIDGILLIDKEVDITSYDVIRKLKPLLPRKYKIGHAGTLDPFATGLLVILLGKATKLMDTIHGYDKEYEVKAEFGYATDTQDNTGKVINQSGNTVPRGVIESTISKYFIGNISQVPPRYSAKQINGKRAYDLARKNTEFELQPRGVEITKFEIIDFEWPFVTFRIVCSTGTYIRTLVNDLGEKVGSYATATTLRRTRIGSFNVQNAISSKDININALDSIIGIDKVKEILKI